ncbi:hypothetical protein E4U03_09850 [Rothia nasimurium]|uniref:Toxin n=1 Tax=Rothia nasimurium TaxID=85336 RepID=A0A4Y9F1D2_9MICC|nr:hypothetical protein [Rothia nasimurium]MBF0808902.1 hypothetical protein [Rothia nasimurium]TFU21087.1 hypothetical protein E4U03_09850 [Rothia nasimurium]
MKFIFLPSAAKHGYTEADALNAMENHMHEIHNFDGSRTPGRPTTTLHIGMAENGDIIEVLSHYITPDVIIFHCMKLRGKTLARVYSLDI